MARAEQRTYLKATPEYYSDFLMDLSRNPVTNLLAKVTNEECVKQSLKVLILTNLTERFYQPYVGSKVRGSLFEPDDSVTNELIISSIRQTIQNNEPRVTLRDVATSITDDNTLSVTIVFSLINIPNNNVFLNIELKRIR